MKKEDLLNNDTDLVLEDFDNQNRLTKGLLIITTALIVVLVIYACTSYNEKKAMQSKIDSLNISNKSYRDNLLMPVEIKKINDLNN